MFRIKRACCLYFYFSACFLCVPYCSWSDLVKNYAATYSTELKDGYVSSLIASCRASKINHREMDLKIETWEVFAADLEKGSIKVNVGLQRSKDKIRKAPLAIFLPGTFGNINQTMGNRWLDSLTRLGYHVASLPNPFGTDYVKQIPMGKFGTITTEAQSLYDAIRDLHQKLRLQGALNGEVRLVGVSLGGFFAAIISSLDAEHSDPLITKDTTILSPPYHLGRGMERLDQLVDTYRDPYDGMSILRLYYRYRKLCKADSLDDIDEDQIHDARGLVAFQGFYKGLLRSIKVYDEVRNLNYVPKDKKEYEQWRNRFKFFTYFEDLNPEGKAIVDSEMGHLLYWAARAKRAGFPEFRILTAKDDFFNDPGAWDKRPPGDLGSVEGEESVLSQNQDLSEQIRKEVIILQNGGHYGYRGNPWFENFIRLAFGSTDDFLMVARRRHFEIIYDEPPAAPEIDILNFNPLE